MDRTPPASIRRLLRREVNFACPVEACGSPYLKYHHFDPPWRVAQHHRPEGMIALCAPHADWADGGRWTKEDLLRMKATPFMRAACSLHGDFGWSRRELVLAAAGLTPTPSVLLRLNGLPTISIQRDRRNQFQLSVDIRDAGGQPVVMMDGNDLLEVSRISDLEDVEMPPRGRKLRLRAPELGVRLEVSFEERCSAELRQLAEMWNMPPDQMVCGVRQTEAEVDRRIEFLRTERGLSEPDLQSMRTAYTKTKFDVLSSYITTWPVALCVLSFDLVHPFQVHVDPRELNAPGLRIAGSLNAKTSVVWDLRG